MDWLFGFNPNCTTDQKDCGMPSVGTMLHAVGNYTWDSCQEIRGMVFSPRNTFNNTFSFNLGINTNKFTTNWHIDEWSADLSVAYYWSGIIQNYLFVK